MIFIDTSVLIAATQKEHSRHEDCLALLAGLEEATGCCALHTLAELYSVLTRFPDSQRLPPGDALAVVELVCKRMTVVPLDAEEILAVIRKLAAKGLSGGIVHDALIVRCAEKIGARNIYTLNPKHFKLVAPEWAALVCEP